MLCHTSAMTTTSAPPLLPHLWKSVLLSGVLSLILGALILLWPGKSILVAAIFFGAFLLVSGITQVFHAFTLHVSAGSRALLFISGAAALVLAGIVVLASPFPSLATLTLVVGIWLVVIGVFEIVASFGIRKASKNIRETISAATS